MKFIVIDEEIDIIEERTYLSDKRMQVNYPRKGQVFN
jgi:hypothetical protein